MPPTGMSKVLLDLVRVKSQLPIANSFKGEYFMQITIILPNLVLANLLKCMPNIAHYVGVS